MNRFRRLAPAIAVVALVPALAFGYIERPVTVSFFPPISTNGADARRVKTNFSFSIIGGYVGAVDGLELGSAFNIVHDGVRGFQLGGGVNVVGGMMVGVQVAGGANVVGGGLRHAQVAGGVNIVGGAGEGAQVAGGANITGGSFRGFQVAGGANITGNLLEGLQLAGGANIVREFGGAQIGVVNIAGTGRGLMLGVVNIVGELDGPAIGLVSVVGNGMFHVDATFADHAAANVAMKFGSKTVYNTVVFGWQPKEPARALLGYGIGVRLRTEPLFLDIDAVGHSVRDPEEPFEIDELPVLAQLRCTGGLELLEGFSLIAGVAGNVWVAPEGEEYNGLYDFTIYDNGSQDTRVMIWPGFSIGVELL